jgi:hypothetical protein
MIPDELELKELEYAEYVIVYYAKYAIKYAE